MKKTKVIVLIALLLCCSAGSWASHVLLPFSSWSGGTLRDNYGGTIGLKFKTGGQAVVVDQLGFIDLETDGLAQSHLLRIWDDVANIVVAEATVPAGTASFKSDSFRYVPVNGGFKVLKANTTYVFSAEVISAGGDKYYDDNKFVHPDTYFVGSNPSTTWNATWGATGAKPAGYWHNSTSYGAMNMIAQPLIRTHDLEVLNMGPVGENVSVKLKWNTALNTEETAVNPNVTKHYVYVGTNEPNLPLVTPITLGAGNPPAASAETTLTLNYDTTYYWKVKESISNSVPSDGNTLEGQVGSFSMSSLPNITGQPVDVYISAGQTATFTVAADSITPMSHQWYKSADSVIDISDTKVGTDSGTYSISNAQVTDEAFYYCVLTNAGGTQSTAVVRLVIKRLMAHWTLDQADFVANQYKDVSTEDPIANNADPNNPAGVTFAAGPYSLGATSAVPVNDSSFALVNGALDPSQYSDQMTISAWVRLTGTLTEADGYGILTKGNAVVGNYENNIRWAFYARNRGTTSSVRFTSWPGGDTWSDPNTIKTNEWVHVAASVTNGRVANVYVNGVQSGYTDSDFIFGGTAADPVRIGRYGAGGNNFPGQIDDIRVYNYGMDKHGIAELYHATSGLNVCIDDYASTYDIVKNCKVDLADFAEFAKVWLSCGLYPNCP